MNDKLSSEAQDFLSLATSEGDISPSDADRKRVRKGVAVALAATSAAGVAASAGSASAAASGAALATGGLGLKALMVVGLVTVAGAGALSFTGPDEADARTSSSATRRAQRAEAAEPSPPSAPALPVAEPTVESVPVPSPTDVTPIAEALTPTPATVPRPSASTRRSPPQVAPPVALDEAPSAMSLSDELGLLRAAQRARVQGNFDEALRQLAEHNRRFPAGRLAAERDGTRVFVLCDAARAAEATSAQRAFLRDHASSPLAHRVRSGCD
ncbi:MAG: hypothetical protein AB8H86_14910 [Polyangiales bacterium]